MHSAPHRNNSDFQLRHFIAGSCYTADGAWALLYNQLLDIQIKHEHTRANVVRRKIKALEFEKRMAEAIDEIGRLTVEADLIEFRSGDGLLELALAGSEKELETIRSLMDELEPQRKYANLPLLEATEAAPRVEPVEPEAPGVPTSRATCKGGGWIAFGFESELSCLFAADEYTRAAD